MNIGIVTDDNAGFPKSEIERLGLFVVPMPIIIDGKEHFEGQNLTQDEFYARQAAGADIHSSQPAPGSVMAIWDKALSKYDAILHIPMSSGLTQAVETAKMLAEDEKYAGKVYVVDNHRISVTQRDSVYDAIALIQQGKSAKEIQERLEADAHASRIYIMVDTLEYLKKGGRVTPAGAALGAVFHIKPILKIEGGKLDAKAKAMGIKKAQALMIQYLKEDTANYFKGDASHLVYGMAYTHDQDKAEAFRLQVGEALGIDPKTIMMNPLSLSIGVHIGPGSLAVTVSRVVDVNAIQSALSAEESANK